MTPAPAKERPAFEVDDSNLAKPSERSEPIRSRGSAANGASDRKEEPVKQQEVTRRSRKDFDPALLAGLASNGEDGSPIPTKPFSEIVTPETAWLWEGRVPLGAVTILAGEQGVGKSLVTASLAAAVSTGDPLVPGEAIACGEVLILSKEDRADTTIKPRLQLHCAALDRVRTGGDGHTSFPSIDLHKGGLALYETLGKMPGVRLVIFDPIHDFLGGKDNDRVRAAMQVLSYVASIRNVAIVAVVSVDPNAKSTRPPEVLGPNSPTAVARAVWLLRRDLDNQDARVLLPKKLNLAKESALRLWIEDNRPLRWEPGPEQDDWIGNDQRHRAYMMSEAERFLLLELANGSVRASNVIHQAKEAGISQRTLERAKGKLGVISLKGSHF